MAYLSNVQETNLRLRKDYAQLSEPLLQQLASLHGLSVRKFARIFGLSPAFAGDLLRHVGFPEYTLAVRIARYFDLDTDSLFGWRVDDDGARSPLIIVIPGIRRPVKLKVVSGMYRTELLKKIQKAKKQGQKGMDKLGIELVPVTQKEATEERRKKRQEVTA